MTQEEIEKYVASARLSGLHPERRIVTKGDIDEFKASLHGKFFQHAIDSRDHAPVARLIQNYTDLYVHEACVWRKVLRENGTGEYGEAFRDLATIAHQISRRGSIPVQTLEGEQIIGVPFDVGNLGSMRLTQMNAWSLSSVVNSLPQSFGRELDSIVIEALVSAATTRGQVVDGDVYSDLGLTRQIGQLADHGIVPAHIVVTFSDYCNLHGRGLTDVNLTLREALKSGNFGSFNGVQYVVTGRAKYGEMLIVCDPHDVGTIDIVLAPQTTWSFDSAKSTHQYATIGTFRILVANDYAVAVAKVNK